jgi:type II secretory pathway component PulF
MKNNIGNLFVVVFAFIAVVMVWGYSVYLIFYIPIYAEMLADFGAQASTVMQFQIEASQFLRQYALFISPLFLIITALPFYLLSGKD